MLYALTQELQSLGDEQKQTVDDISHRIANLECMLVSLQSIVDNKSKHIYDKSPDISMIRNLHEEVKQMKF